VESIKASVLMALSKKFTFDQKNLEREYNKEIKKRENEIQENRK